MDAGERGVTGPTLVGKRIVLGVTGSIAAYKAVSLLRALVREGATVALTARPSCAAFLITVDALARSRETAFVRFAATLAGGAFIVWSSSMDTFIGTDLPCE